MKLGFTGTRDGMTAKQYQTVVHLIGTLKPDVVIHGDCIGADQQFHEIIDKIRKFNSVPTIRILPGTVAKKRAHCNGDIIDPPQPPLARNREIAHLCDKLIACPKESAEQLRSGTWSTIRYARLANKTVYLVIPNGEIR